MNRELVSPFVILRGVSDRAGVVREDVARSVAAFFHTPLIALLVAISYYAGTKIGFLLTPSETPIGTFWPPNAILFAAFLLAPPQKWWAFLLAVFPAHLLIQLHAGMPVSSALGWFIGNAGEALMGAVCIRYFVKELNLLFKTVRGVSIFLAFGVILAPLVTTFLDAAVVVVTGRGSDYWTLWMTRLSSNMISNLTIVPAIMIFVENGVSWIRKATLVSYFEAGLLAFGTVFVSFLVFGRQGAANGILVLIYTLLPLLVWASFRFGLGGLSASMLVLSLISMWNAIQGRGPLMGTSVTRTVLFLHILLAIFAVPMMLLATAIEDRRRTEESLRNTRSKLIDAQDQERQRIGRELHDDIVQQVTLLGLEVDQLRTESDPSMKPGLDRLYDQVSNVSEAARDLSHGLHPFALQYLGLTPGLRTLCRHIDAQSFTTITFVEENVPPALAADVSLCLYRVVQEALQNIVKHSHAHTATIELKVSSGRALLRIVDDGVGLSSEQLRSEGMGLTSMRERVMALDGTFKITSVPLKGTTIEVSVPLKRS
jgi:signal transduction histidine kinase